MVIVNEAAYVIDCGVGVATHLARADVRLGSLRHVFITHHHSDHNAEYGPLLLTAWGSGLRTQVDTWHGRRIEPLAELPNHKPVILSGWPMPMVRHSGILADEQCRHERTWPALRG